jgi:hypothetical protein
VSDEQCKHIMFAAWGRASYLSLLQSPPAKVTVIEGAKMGAGIEVFLKSIPLTAFPNIFMPAQKTDSLRAILSYAQPESTSGTNLLSVITDKVLEFSQRLLATSSADCS